MTLVDTWVPKAPPLREDETGTVRIGKTRVTLDTIIAYYKQGMSAEDLASDFDTVGLADIHAVLSYYLQNRDKVDAYLAEREQEAQAILEHYDALFPPKIPPGEMRARLLQRKFDREKQGK